MILMCGNRLCRLVILILVFWWNRLFLVISMIGYLWVILVIDLCILLISFIG